MVHTSTVGRVALRSFFPLAVVEMCLVAIVKSRFLDPGLTLGGREALEILMISGSLTLGFGVTLLGFARFLEVGVLRSGRRGAVSAVVAFVLLGIVTGIVSIHTYLPAIALSAGVGAVAALAVYAPSARAQSRQREPAVRGLPDGR
jgi:hypothetical protein